MSKIDRIRCYMTRVDDRPRLLVAITTEDGITGWGEAYNHGPDHALEPVIDWLAHHLAGEDATRVTYINQKLLQHFRFPPGAIGLAAIAAIDHALWDISAKALGVPVYKLLGGAVRDRIEVYCGVYTAPDVGETIDIVQDLRERSGFRAFKLSPYRRSPNVGRWGLTCAMTGRWFGQIREAFPEEEEFAFDAHAMIFEPIRAVQLAQALAPHDPMFLEEPIRPENIAALAAMKAKAMIPIATGECLYNRYEFLNLLKSEAADIIQPDIAVVGGLTEMRRIADLADAHYVSVMPHNPMGPLATAHNLHFAAAQVNFRMLEYRPPEHAPWAVDPYEPVDGYLALRPDRPGWGIEIDEAALASPDYVHWERRVETRPDGSTAFP